MESNISKKLNQNSDSLTIDMKEMYKNMKEKALLKGKQIKQFLLYNFLQDSIPTIVLDLRKEVEGKDSGRLINYHTQDSFTLLNYSKDIKPQTRLVSIIENNAKLDEILDREDQVKVKYIIGKCSNIEKLFYIESEDYKEFTSIYGFLLISDKSSDIDRTLVQTNFPMCIIDGILFCGSFIQSRNLHQLKLLNIHSIIGVTKEDEKLRKKLTNKDAEFVVNDVTFFPVDEENKGEIDFDEVYKQFVLELEDNNCPILIYCFSGKTVSVATCIMILMRFRKLNLLAATAIMMKIMPDFKLPPWLFSQLQRLKIK